MQRTAILLTGALLTQFTPFAPRVIAAPPPGHLSAENAIELVGAASGSNTKPNTPAADLPHLGTVLSATDSNAFTYLEVRDNETGKPRWLAVPRMAVKTGDKVRFDEGGVMTNFYSRKHGVTFESIMFVKNIALVP